MKMSVDDDSGVYIVTPLLSGSENAEKDESCNEFNVAWSEDVQETTPLTGVRNVNLESIGDLSVKKTPEDHPSTTNCEAMMHILKGNIGTGILAIPNALANSGIVIGTVGLIFVSIVCVHCMHVVLRSSNVLSKRSGRVNLGYAETAELAFLMGPVKCRRFSRAARILTGTFLCITQLGFCCVYFVFISTNIMEVVSSMTGVNYIDYRIYMLGLLLPMISLNMIRNLKYLAPVSTIANILQTVALGLLFYYLIRDIHPASSRKAFATWQQLPLWFGTVIYAFEGVSLVLPVKNDMKYPQTFGGLNGVLNTAMSIVACLYIAVGFFGYLSYGDNVQGSITLNLPNEMLAYVICILYSTSIFLSYAVQFYVPIRIIWPSVQARVPDVAYHGMAERVLRIFLILVTFGFAALIPRLDLFISLVGALSGSYLALILPPILNIITFNNDGVSGAVFLKDVCIVVVGILGFITGTYASIVAIYKAF